MAENTFASQKFCNGDDTLQENGSSDAHTEDAKSKLEIIRKGIDDPDEKDDKEDHNRGPFVLFKPIDEDSDSECDAVDNFRVQPHSNVKNIKSLNDNSDSEVSDVHKSPLDRGDNCKLNKESENVPFELSETPKSNVEVRDDSGGQNTDGKEKLVNGIIGIDSVLETSKAAYKERTEICDEKIHEEDENSLTIKESKSESIVKKENEQHNKVESTWDNENKLYTISERKDENEQHARLERKQENENEMHSRVDRNKVNENEQHARLERKDGNENEQHARLQRKEGNENEQHARMEGKEGIENEQHPRLEGKEGIENEQHPRLERKEGNENEQHSRQEGKEGNENDLHARLERKEEIENEQHAIMEGKEGIENEQHPRLERKEENENELHAKQEGKEGKENEQHAKQEGKEGKENEQHARQEKNQEFETEQNARLERKEENENEQNAKQERKEGIENEQHARLVRKGDIENEKPDKVACNKPTEVDQKEKGIKSMKTMLVEVEDQSKQEESEEDRTENSSYQMEEVMNVDGSKVIITLNDNESDQEKDYNKKKYAFPYEKARETKKELTENSDVKSVPFPVDNNDSNKPSVVDPAAKSSVSKDKVAVLTTPGKSSGQGNDSVMVVSITPPGQSATVLTNSLKASTSLASTMSSLNMPMHSGIRLMQPNVVTVPSLTQQNAAFIPYYLPQSSVPFPLQNRVTTPRMTVSPHSQQTGYITKVGNQTIFVPLANSTGKPIAPFPTVTNMRPSYMPQNAVMTATGQHSSTVKPEVNKVTEFVTPKSSMDMMEMCKWEIANRMPDNYNWSVVFHPKKDMEVSAITAFLQELGSDIVKEAVYKDIIHIQTNKKEMGKLTDGEIVSLEKMKTVYKETKDRVGDLKLDYKKCRACNFITESRNVMAYHKEFAHNGLKEGDLLCARCNFSTRNKEAFVFHMESEHKLQGKIVEKRAFYECELCPFETNNKNKLTRHRFRCAKQFKLQQNLQPYYHDVNFCMKTMYFKVKKPVIKNPVHDTRHRNQNLSQKSKAAQPSQQPQKVVPMPMVSPNMNMIRQVGPQTPLRMPFTIPPNTPTTNIAANKQHLASALQKPAQSNLFPHTSPVGQFSINKTAAPAPISSPATTIGRMDMSKFEVCELCGGYVKDRQALRIHFYYAHKVEMPLSIFSRPQPPLICEVCQARFWTTQGLSKHKTNTKHFSAPSPASSKDQRCFMCSRTVPNLFVHIEQVHGITMKDLVAMKKCIMCGTTASNRRELEIHMAALHGVLIKASEIDKPAPIGTAFKAVPSPVQGAAVIAGKKQSLVRNNLCVFCQVQFNDNIQLTMHCIKNHATCSACGMVVARKADLENHHCKKLASRSCPLCNLRKLTPEAYLKHVKTHMKKCSVNVKQMSEDELAKYPKPIKKPVEVINLLDSDDDDDDNDSQASSDKVKTAAGVKLENKEAEEKHEKKTAQEDDTDVSKNSAKEKEPESENSKTRKRKLDVDDNGDSKKEKSEDDGQPPEKIPNLESEKELIESDKAQ